MTMMKNGSLKFFSFSENKKGIDVNVLLLTVPAFTIVFDY